MRTSLISLDAVMQSEQEFEEGHQYVKRARMQGSINLAKIEFMHPGARTSSLKINAFSATAGDRIALIGPIGSGKSTLLKLISGLFSAERGEVLIDNLDIRQIDPVDLRRNVAYLPQETRLFRGTLRENLSVGAKSCDDPELLKALEFGGLAGFVMKHELGLDLRIGDGGEGLSVGQRQSIGLARIFLLDPAIVLLDEPTSAFDQALEKDFIVRLNDWLGQRTCIIATHRTPILALVHKVALVVEGQIVKVTDRETVVSNLDSRIAKAQV